MPDSASDLTGILTELIKADSEIGFRSGLVQSFDTTTGNSVIVIAGAPISNIPFLSRSEALALRVGDVVGILKVKNQYFVLGRISVNPGEIVIRDGDGSITVQLRRTSAGGGEIATFHPNGVPHAIMGQLFNEGTGDVLGQGLVIQRDDFVDLMGAGSLTPGGPEIVRINDTNGARAFQTDESLDGMLDRPFLEVPMYPLSDNGNFFMTGTVETTLAIGRLWVTHPYIRIQVRAWVSAGTGRIRAYVGGTEITSAAVTFTNTTTAFIDLGNLRLPQAQINAPYSFQTLTLTATNTGGDNTTSVIPYGATKRGTP